MTTCPICGRERGTKEAPIPDKCWAHEGERAFRLVNLLDCREAALRAQRNTADRRGKLLERAAECLDSGRDWTATTAAIRAELGPAAQKGSEHG